MHEIVELNELNIFCEFFTISSEINYCVMLVSLWNNNSYVTSRSTQNICMTIIQCWSNVEENALQIMCVYWAYYVSHALFKNTHLRQFYLYISYVPVNAYVDSGLAQCTAIISDHKPMIGHC